MIQPLIKFSGHPKLNREMIDFHLYQAPATLSREYREDLVERLAYMAYQHYITVLQPKRQWNPNTSFNWSKLQTNWPRPVKATVSMFFGTEHYTSDFVSELLCMIRKNHGRSQFHIAWGSEEEKHSDLWRNALLFSKTQTYDQNRKYSGDLLANQWTLPFDTIRHMLAYTEIQEQATLVNYVNLRKIARGESEHPELADFKDSVLEEVCRIIAKDESAHAQFFATLFKVHLYFFPDEMIEAFFHVASHFDMPGSKVIPRYLRMALTMQKYDIYSEDQYFSDVLLPALNTQDIKVEANFAEGIRTLRSVPHPSLGQITSAVPLTIDPLNVQRKVRRTFSTLQDFQKSIGFDQIEPPLEFPTLPVYPVEIG